MTEIIAYENKYQPDFYRLNIAWLNNYQLTESYDLEILDNPEDTIINKGGFIWLAKSVNNIIGTVALIRESNEMAELAKMSVDNNYQGKGIGKLLIGICIGKAREIGIKKIQLYSNHQLTTALSLYKKYGFQQITLVDSPFQTADVKMELSL